MFYAPWCGHCTAMKEAYSKAAKLVADSNIGALAALDCTANSQTQGKYLIQGFPTLKYFENGKFSRDYSGARTTDDLVKFMKKDGKVKDEF